MTTYHKCTNPNCINCNPEKYEKAVKDQAEKIKEVFELPQEVIFAIVSGPGKNMQPGSKGRDAVLLGGDLSEIVSLIVSAMKIDSTVKAVLRAAVLGEDVVSLLEEKLPNLFKDKPKGPFNYNQTEYKA